MKKVARHLFVPEGVRGSAYDDRALSIGGGGTISQPYRVVSITEASHLSPEHKVLGIETGSGYRGYPGGDYLSPEKMPRPLIDQLADGGRIEERVMPQ